MLSIKLMFLVALSFFGSFSKANPLIVQRAIPTADYTDCVNADVAQSCLGAVERGWRSGHFQSFTRQHNFYSDPLNSCKITYFSNEAGGVKMVSADQIKEALLQIHTRCMNLGVPKKDCNQQRVNSRAVFVGMLSERSVTILLGFEQATYGVGQCE